MLLPRKPRRAGQVPAGAGARKGGLEYAPFSPCLLRLHGLENDMGGSQALHSLSGTPI